MNRYVPPYSPPSERYWQALLEEGPVSSGEGHEVWEWVGVPIVPLEIWNEAQTLQCHRTVLELEITGFNRGGLIAYWKGVECFVPASHLIAYPFPADPVAREQHFSEYIGKTLRLCLIEVEPARNRLLLSERQVAECDLKEPEWPDWLCLGGICKGTVTTIRPFGVFVDIGPLEGMIHISEISWGRVRDPEEFLKPGQEVQVKIISVDLEHQRVGLSLKRLQPNPWETVEERLSPGDVVTGSIASVERFGIFVEIFEGIEGLLHISELGLTEDALDFQSTYKVNDPITVRILEIVASEHRIALALADSEGPYAEA